MHSANRVITVVLGLMGVALVVYGASRGVWPISMQLIAGVLMIVYAAVRWRYFW